MKRLMISAAVAASLAMPAMAADLPVKAPAAPAVAPISWTGWYLGIDGGWGDAHYDHSFNTADHYNKAAGDTFDYSKSGGLLGGHLGYNWQAGQWVLGLEGGITKSWLDSSDNISPFFPGSDRWTSKVSWIASVTPRVGVAFGNVLVYGKGGVAFAHLSDHVQDNADFVDFSTTRTGWTLGGGVEYMVVPNWIVGLEYNHFDFGSANVNLASTDLASGLVYPFGTNHDFKVTVDAVQARLSYKFGSLWP